MKKAPVRWLVVAGCLALASCSGSEGTVTTSVHTPTSLAVEQVAAPPLPSPDPGAGLSGEALLVSIEARWMCDVQRFAFADLTAMETVLDERLRNSGLERSEYDAFKRELADRIELREQVLVEYEEYCGDD